jgi:hypothetical protein
VDSSGDETKLPAVLFNVRNSAAGFCSLLDEVIDNDRGAEDISENPENGA